MSDDKIHLQEDVGFQIEKALRRVAAKDLYFYNSATAWGNLCRFIKKGKQDEFFKSFLGTIEAYTTPYDKPKYSNK